MTEPWFDPNLYAWIPGALLGTIGGGVGGTLMGVCAPRGVCRGLVMGFMYVMLAASVALFAVGVIAWSKGQPYGIWYGIGFPGALGIVLFRSMLPLVRRRYQEAELRKLNARDL